MTRNRVADSELPPYANVCLIEMYRVTHEGTPVSFVNRSTGFFIAPHVIVTAGHSLGEHDSRIHRLEIYPHQNSQVKSEQKLAVESPDFVIRKVPEYHNPYCYVKDDFGIIILKNEDLPAWTTHHFDWQNGNYAAQQPVAGQEIRIAGYPIDRPDFELWEESGKIVEVTKHCLLHPFTTTKRNSGSPIWSVEQGTPRVVGIHVSGNAASCGARPENRPYGSAVLINKRVYETINGWIAEADAERANADRDFRLAL
jgi:glutamyl endopeptidase